MSARWVGRSLAWALGVCAALAACAGQSAPAPGRVPVVAARSRVEPIGGRVLARIDAGGLDVVSIVPAGGLLWVSSTEQRRLTEVDPRRNVVVGHLALPGHAGTVVSVGGNLWVLLAPERLLVMVDPRRRRIVRFARVEAPQWPTSLAAGDGQLWVGDGSQTASRRDIHSGATLARVRLTGTRNGPGAMAMANGVVWAGEEAFVDRIDAHHARVLRPAQAGPTPLMSVYAWGSDVWVGNWNWGQMRRLDARTGRLRGVYRFGGAGMAEDGHELWTTTALTTRSRRGDDPILTRLDLRSDRVTGRYRVGRRATPTSLNFCGAVRDYYEACPNPRPGIQALSLGAVAVADGSLWLAQNVERRIYRLRLAP